MTHYKAAIWRPCYRIANYIHLIFARHNMALEENVPFIKISVHAQAKINENPRQLCHNHLIPGFD